MISLALSRSGAHTLLSSCCSSRTALVAAVDNQLVYSAHDYGPTIYQQPWFNSSTCYKSGCSSSSLADIWNKNWAYINVGNVNPLWSGGDYPGANTGSTAYTQTPVCLGEFGTGSEGQWFTDLINFVNSSYALATANNSGIAVSHLQWTYWALNVEDSDGLLGSNDTGLAYPTKEYSYLCFNQSGPFAIPPGTGSGQCGSTGTLPIPR